MSRVEENLKVVRDRIRRAAASRGAGENPVTLVVVTKSASLEDVMEVIRLGHRDLAESRVQQLKKLALEVRQSCVSDGSAGSNKINWHMIGHLQRNKVKPALEICPLIHSVDTLRLAESINGIASRLRLKAGILLQVNTSNESRKYGVPVGAAVHMAEQIETLPAVKLRGMMVMAPLTDNNDIIRDCFRRARELFEEMRGERIVSPQFTELSMGMSHDYEIAVEEGATMVRIGTAIFQQE